MACEWARSCFLKLGITRPKGCIAAILPRNGLPPSPQRQWLTWQQFLARHADGLLCTDLFSASDAAATMAPSQLSACSLRR